MGCAPSAQNTPDSRNGKENRNSNNANQKSYFSGRSKGKKGGGVDMKDPIQADKMIKAAMLIQRWYRTYLARIDARRRATWNIFQSLEYADEQDQLKLYNFFHDMMLQVELSKDDKGENVLSALINKRPVTRHDSVEEEDKEILRLTDPDEINVPSSYRGPQIKFPITPKQVQVMIEHLKKKQTALTFWGGRDHILHAKYALQILHETRKVLKTMPNVNQASTALSNRITVVGDLHGKMDDLFIIFYKRGLPTADNPFLFNGDFVDRGPHSIEIALILFCFLIINPKSIYINRGNHEDHVMNLRYGFIKEVMMKYRETATKLIRLFEDVFSWLPLATVIDNKILVIHGGISDRTDVEYLNTIDRHKYLSALRPPIEDEDMNDSSIDTREWRQILDILWSDPKPVRGCTPNTFRGGGSYWGPDITDQILKKHNYELIIRSHECKPDGYEYCHDQKVLTIFSASSYYEVGSNKGAIAILVPNLKPHIVQYMASKFSKRKLTMRQSDIVDVGENTALKTLHAKIFENKPEIMKEFQSHDPNNTGNIKLADWCDSIKKVMNMPDLPWRTLRPSLAKIDEETGLIIYNSTFDTLVLSSDKISNENNDMTEALYRNKNALETIFRAIDTDNSGFITLEEFANACKLLSRHTGSQFSQEELHTMCNMMDTNKDGHIDFNEFLEAFRVTDKLGKDPEKNSQIEKVMKEANDLTGFEDNEKKRSCCSCSCCCCRRKKKKLETISQDTVQKKPIHQQDIVITVTEPEDNGSFHSLYGVYKDNVTNGQITNDQIENKPQVASIKTKKSKGKKNAKEPAKAAKSNDTHKQLGKQKSTKNKSNKSPKTKNKETPK